jgi:hypothetical protein
MHFRSFVGRVMLVLLTFSAALLAASPAAASHLRVQHGATVIPHLGTFAFGSTPVGQPLSRTFTVTNIGASPVTIGPYGLTGTSSDPNFYEYGAINVPAPLNPGQSGAFEIIYRANAAGSSHEMARLFVGGSAHHEFWMDATATSSLPTCNGPGSLLKELDSAIRTGAPAGLCEWRGHIKFDYNQWTQGSSHNLPVVAAAVALFAEPVQPGGDIRNWWWTFLEAQLGDRTTFPSWSPKSGQALPAALTYFHSTEAFSSTYDPSVVTSVLAVHYWAHFNPGALNASLIEPLAKRYLRATWGVYALASGTDLALNAYKNGQHHHPTSPNKFQYGSGGAFYSNSSFMALAGTRMNPSWWGADNRVPLLTAALGMNPDPAPGIALREEVGQRGVRTLVDDWTGVFGLTTTEQAGLIQLVDTKAVPSFLTSMFTKIRTRSRFHFVAQPGFVGTCMETAENGNGPHTFAVGYRAQGQLGAAAQEAQFLYPGDAASQQGRCEVDLTARVFRVYNAKVGGSVLSPKGTIDFLPGALAYHFRLDSTGLTRLQ